MGVYKLSTAGGLATPRTNYSSFLAGNPAVTFTSYESIATVNITTNTANIDFTSIPSTYTHLQIRGIARNSNASSGGININMQFNSDTGSNYSHHYLGTYQGEGAAVWAGGAANESFIVPFLMPTNNLGASIFSAGVIDILDYKDTNKYKTIRGLGGYDMNGAATGYNYLNLNSGNWRSTSAITSIKLYGTSGNFMQYTQFALYGIKGA
jgi:hypothetical protein